jgi:hypothetical protein
MLINNYDPSGFTIFDNLYTFNNTFFVVTSNPSSVPERRDMLSAGLPLSVDPYVCFSRVPPFPQLTILTHNSNEKEANRPTDRDLQIISPQQARDLFGQSAGRLDGVSFIQTDPMQFLHHYFHFVVGVSSTSPTCRTTNSHPSSRAEVVVHGLWRVYSSLDPHIPHTGETSLPPPRRLIFPHCDPLLWRDRAGLNIFFLRTAFPGLSIEYSQDWAERASIGQGGPASAETGLNVGQYPRTARALVLDRVVLGDRAAWERSPHNVKNPAHQYPLVVSRHWWAPVRRAVVEYAAGARSVVWPGEVELDALLTKGATEKPRGERPVITYVNRQSTGRRLLDQDHEALVAALEDLGRKYDYEVVVASMEFMNKFDQIYLSSRTTVRSFPFFVFNANLLFQDYARRPWKWPLFCCLDEAHAEECVDRDCIPRVFRLGLPLCWRRSGDSPLGRLERHVRCSYHPFCPCLPVSDPSLSSVLSGPKHPNRASTLPFTP